MVSPKQELRAIKEDPDDNRILEGAIEACSEFIVSWDKDLLRLKEFEGISTVSPPQFLDRLRERSIVR